MAKPRFPCKADGCTNTTANETGYCRAMHHNKAAWAAQKESKAEWFANQPEDNITDAVIAYALRTNQATKLYEDGRVEKDDDCLIWQGAKNGRYGMIGISVKESSKVFTHPVLAHRLAYAMVNELPPSQSGPKPDTLTINHKCYNRLCVNPAHLEVLSQEENFKDALVHYEVEGTCECCSAPFTGPPSKVYCSPRCWKKDTRRKAKAA